MSTRRVLTLKYRPQSFDELLVQDHVKRTLTRAIEQQRFANAYLFAGPRGVGKTTTARLLAKSLNCLSFKQPTVKPCNDCSACTEIAASRSMDVLEIDGASNRGIDQVRELRENIRYAPASLRFKVYIIDEVHMLTDQAFNALLKTLEEPPPHAKFVFATTAAHKVPATIISRCQRFDFRKASPEEIAGRLRWLAGREKIKVDEPALLAVARRSDGAIRDGESILEQLATFRPEGIGLADVEELLGLVPGEQFAAWFDLLLAGDSRQLLANVDRLLAQGHDLAEFYSGLVNHARNLLVVQAAGSAAGLGLTDEEQRALADQAARLTRGQLLCVTESLLAAEEGFKFSQQPRVVFEHLSLELAADLAGATAEPDPPPAPPGHKAARPPTPSGPAANPPPAAPSLESLWQELILKFNARKPIVARYLDQCRPESFADGVLTACLTQSSEFAVKKLKADARLIDETLTALAGRPARLQLTVRAADKECDPLLGRITRIMGEVQEERP